jgi:hypothetical protein
MVLPAYCAHVEAMISINRRRDYAVKPESPTAESFRNCYVIGVLFFDFLLLHMSMTRRDFGFLTNEGSGARAYL